MNARPTCLTVETITRIRGNDISNREYKELEDHLTRCEECRARLESGEKDPEWIEEILPALVAEEEVPQSVLDPENPEHEVGSLDHILRLLGPTDNPHMLGRIGHYEVVGVVGRGGMGVVFKAFEPSLNRMVAIKMLLPHLAASAAARKRFAREGKAAAAVIDDHVMPIHGVSEWQGIPYLVMRYSPGPNLQKRVEKQGPLELEEILRIGTQTAKGLAAAHAQGLVHRDVKPSNILLDGTVERAMLTDFGLARAADDATLTRSGMLAGTPQYMSPEQIKGEQVDSRADLFGLGCVLYTLCTGKPPFDGENSYAILRQITDGAPQPIREINPRLPSWLCGLIGRLMAKRPERRPNSAQEVAEMLEGALAHVQQSENTLMPPILNPTMLTRPKFNRVRIGVLFMIASLFAGLGWLLVVQTEPNDIAGNWDGNEWGSVVLRKTGAVSWEGTYSETTGKKPGNIALRWSRIERRFNGTWNEENDARFGKLSLRLAEGNLVGAYTTDNKSRDNPETPKLADLGWRRSVLQNFTGSANPPKITSSGSRYQHQSDLLLKDPKNLFPTKPIILKECSPEKGQIVLTEWGRVLGQKLTIPEAPGGQFQFESDISHSPLPHQFLILTDGNIKKSKDSTWNREKETELQKQMRATIESMRVSSKLNFEESLKQRSSLDSFLLGFPRNEGLIKRIINQTQLEAMSNTAFWLQVDKKNLRTPGIIKIPSNSTAEECVSSLESILIPFGMTPVTRVAQRSGPNGITSAASSRSTMEDHLLQLANDQRNDSELNWDEFKNRWYLRLCVIDFLEAFNVGPAAYLEKMKTEKPTLQDQQFETNEKLMHLGKALLEYHQKNGRLPPAVIQDKNGTPLYSWRVLLLPLIGEEEIFKRWKLNEPWNSPNNKPLSEIAVPSYGDFTTNKTAFRVFSGKNGLFDESTLENLSKDGKSLTDVKDTLEKTILVIKAGQKVAWAEPVEIPLEASKDLPALGNVYPGGFQVLWANGKIGTLPETTPKENILMLATPKSRAQ